MLATILTLQGLLQVIVLGLSPFVAVVGIHNYLFFLPILFIFPLCLTPKYRRNFIWWNLIGSIPMCLLAIAQNISPKQAWVNRTSEGGEAFGVPGADVARPQRASAACGDGIGYTSTVRAVPQGASARLAWNFQQFCRARGAVPDQI